MKPWQRAALILLTAAAIAIPLGYTTRWIIERGWQDLAATPTGTPWGPVGQCTPDATTLARLSNAEATLAALEPTAVSLATAVSSWATECAPPTPTATRRPTVTPTPLPGVLCKSCQPGQPDRTVNGCDSGYTCWPCSGLGYRCLDKSSLSGSCTTCRNQPGVQQSAKADGLTVYHIYDVDHDAMVCAVDCTVKDALKGKTLRVCTVVNERWHQYERCCVDVVVTDCGYLYDEGLFSYEPKPVGDLIIPRWWAGNELIMLVDMSPGALRVISPQLETVAVTVEVLE